jgi:hypothetical protein
LLDLDRKQRQAAEWWTAFACRACKSLMKAGGVSFAAAASIHPGGFLGGLLSGSRDAHFALIRDCPGPSIPYIFRTTSALEAGNINKLLILLALPRGLEPLFSP